jgi:hypothetical protein
MHGDAWTGAKGEDGCERRESSPPRVFYVLLFSLPFSYHNSTEHTAHYTHPNTGDSRYCWKINEREVGPK